MTHPLMKIEAVVNGQKKHFEIEAGMLLADLLRREGYFSVKKGCSEGTCGTCTVLIDGKARNSCITFAAHIHKKNVMTVEGLGTLQDPHPLQKAFVEEGSTQCGFCNPGSLLSARALIERSPAPTEEEIREALDGNLCRCTGYVRRIKAVMKAAEVMRKAKAAKVARADAAGPIASATPAAPAVPTGGAN